MVIQFTISESCSKSSKLVLELSCTSDFFYFYKKFKCVAATKMYGSSFLVRFRTFWWIVVRLSLSLSLYIYIYIYICIYKHILIAHSFHSFSFLLSFFLSFFCSLFTNLPGSVSYRSVFYGLLPKINKVIIPAYQRICIYVCRYTQIMIILKIYQ